MDPVAHDCVGAVLVRDGRLLLGRRAADRAWLPGAWDVIGGHIEHGESAEDALRRELLEELGITPLRWRPLAVLEEDAQPSTWRLALFVVDAWTGAPRNLRPDEHDALRWCTLDEAQSHLRAAHPAFPDVLAAAARPQTA